MYLSISGIAYENVLCVSFNRKYRSNRLLRNSLLRNSRLDLTGHQPHEA